MGAPTKSKGLNKGKRKLSATPVKQKPHGYMCVSCGRVYDRQHGNFYKSKSVIFAANEQYVHICKECLMNLYTQLVEFYDLDECRAMERICMLLDLYYSDTIMEATTKANAGTRIAAYISRLNLAYTHGADKTYNDTVIEARAAKVGISDTEDARIANETQEIRVTQRDLDTFGFGWSPEEYAMMRRLYRNFRDGKGDLTPKEELDLVSLCTTRVQINRALARGDDKTYVSLNNLYMNLSKEFEERFKKESAAQQASIDPIGSMIRTIEQYTPAEYYKDKELYKDSDEFMDYIQRFITRPLKNIVLGTKEMDPEYSVEDGSQQ